MTVKEQTKIDTQKQNRRIQKEPQDLLGNTMGKTKNVPKNNAQ